MKTCIITGASSGIGRAAAVEISNKNNFDNIVIIGRNIEELKKTRELMDINKTISLVIHDLDDLERIPKVIQDIFHEFGSIDCLCNIAGYTDPQPLLNTSLDNLIKTYNINVFAPILLIRESVKYMKDNNDGGKILNVSSTAASTSRPGWLSYASSKAAVNSISMTLSDELNEYGIKVYNISPGRCATALRKKLAPNEDPDTIMQPNDVAKVISNLLHDDENVLDGQNITIRKK